MSTKQNPKKTVYDNYTPVHALAISFEVYDNQGFIRSGEGYRYFDPKRPGEELVVQDNKTVTINQMKAGYQPPAERMKQAEDYITQLTGELMFKKMAGTLSSFEKGISAATSQDLTNYHVAIIASLPHGMKVSQKRQKLEEQMSYIKHHSQFFGECGVRYNMEATVIDAKFVQSRDVYMITLMYNERDIIKFWWGSQPDLADIIENKVIKFRGTVTRHETNKFTQCKETIINRVKINSI